MSLSLTGDLRYSIVSQKESHLVTAILTRRQPSVEACGEMMSFDGREAGSLIQFCSFDLRTVEVRYSTAGATFSSVSLASVVMDRNYSCMLLTVWGDVSGGLVWHQPGGTPGPLSCAVQMEIYFGFLLRAGLPPR